LKKVLFITYYWPPSGKASLQWPLKIIKYLSEFNWKPVVLTVDDDTFSENDHSFDIDISPDLNVYRAKAYEPFGIYKKITGKENDSKLIASETISKANKGFAHRISIWIRMNLFVPDARVGWYFPAIKKGTTVLQGEPIDAIVTIGPPHTAHLVGKKLSLKFHIPHLPVFIDPWVDIAYYKDFKRNKLTLSIDNRFEKSVLENASSVVFVTKTMKEDYIKKYPSIKDKSSVLYWGYSEEEFEGITVLEKSGIEKTIVHAGNIFAFQNPVNFWKQINKENESGNTIKLKFIGTVAPEIKNAIVETELQNYTEYWGFLSYKKMLEEICNADFLLVCATEPRHVPGKLFEYLRTGKPVIAFGDDNTEVRNILEDAGAGMMFNYKDSGEEFFRSYSLLKTKEEFVKGFERKEITSSFGEILDTL
jgi:glycosyltransferase involved in cell wall biosynthesis